MKHLKLFESFGSIDSITYDEVVDIYQDFLDEFNIVRNGSGYSNNDISFYIFMDPVYNKGRIKITIVSNNRGREFISDGPHNGFDGLPSNISGELEKAHNRFIQHFNIKDFVIGSYSKYRQGSFVINYYDEKTKFIFDGKEFNPKYLLGDSYIRQLPIIGGYLVCNDTHENIFNYFNSTGISGIFSIFGGSDELVYMNPIYIISGNCDKFGYCVANSPIEQWITKHWSDMCVKYKIRESNKELWNPSRKKKKGDPTVYEFMDYLVEQQRDFKNYQPLPKTLKR
jgi:hypothetical protein